MGFDRREDGVEITTRESKSPRILEEYMLKWKRGTITDAELNLFHDKIEKFIWQHIHNSTCSIPKREMYQLVWAKIVSKKDQWDEKRNTRLLTWLFYVVRSAVGTQKWNQRKKSPCFSEVPESQAWVVESENISCINVEPFGRGITSPERVGRFMERLNGRTSKLACLYLWPPSNVLEKYNKHKKAKRKRLSRKELMLEMEMSRQEYNQTVGEMRDVFYATAKKGEDDVLF